MRRLGYGHRLATGALAWSSLSPGASAALAVQEQSEAPAAERREPGEGDRAGERDVVILGKRGSVQTDVAPVATFDSNAILATGASTISELLRTIRGTAQSADGSDPILLLMAQRVSNQEINALPVEAIEKIEIFPEPVALKFGYPPTRRVLNFITKAHFRQNELRLSAGTATRGGTATEKANLAITRLKDSRRLTLGLEYRHTDPLYRSDRNILPDPDITFDAVGNVRGATGEIDPALSAAVGHAVSIAGLPDDPAARSSLSAYVNRADKPRLFDVGPWRTMVAHNDAIKGEAALADKIGGTLAGSISLSAEQSRDRSLSGLATARLVVPKGNPWSPFAGTVLLDRYLIETAPLAQSQTTTTLHAGFFLRGAIAGWQWDVTGTLDQQLIEGRNERNIDMSRANAAIAAGTNPFVPLDAALLTDRLIDVVRQRSRTAGTKAVATNTPIRLPAGPMSVTATAEAERVSTDSTTRGANPFDLGIGRTRTEAGLAIDIPLTSRREKVLPFIGDLSANGSVRARNVGGFGALHDASYGLSWSPVVGVQLLGNIKHSAAAPDMTALSTPTFTVTDVPVFDYAAGRTVLATLIRGGNPDLRAEHRQVRSLGLTVQPWQKRQWRLNATYEETTIRDQTGTVSQITPQTQAALPDLFVRDSAGHLVSVAYRPTNFALERRKTLSLTVTASGQLTKPKPPAPGQGMAQPNYYYIGIGPTIRFSDRLQLRPGSAELDLLGGDSVTSTTPRASGYLSAGISSADIGVNLNAWASAGSRLRNVDPAGDLIYAPYLRFEFGANIGLNRLLGNRPWAKTVQLRLDIANLTDAHQRIRLSNGTTPNRFQRDYNDPTGRTVTVSLRKKF